MRNTSGRWKGRVGEHAAAPVYWADLQLQPVQNVPHAKLPSNLPLRKGMVHQTMTDRERMLIALELNRFVLRLTIAAMVLVCVIGFIGANS